MALRDTAQFARLTRDVLGSRGEGFESIKIYEGERVEITGSTDHTFRAGAGRDYIIETPDGRFSEVGETSLEFEG